MDSAAPSPSPSTAPEPAAPSQPKPKRPKHTRVHKREKELYGLVTPVFLPLLDAREPPEIPREPPTGAEAGPPSRAPDKPKDARKSRKESRDTDSAAVATAATDADTDATKKLKRSVVCKSSLRHKDSPRLRRNKRVSLVIDGQTVLPADTIIEPTLVSPTSEATSASTSTASLDDLIDPRLTRPEPSAHTSQNHAVHHSLPLTTTHHTHGHVHGHNYTSTKAPSQNNTATTPAATPAAPQVPAPTFVQPTSSPPLPLPRFPAKSLSAPQNATRTFLDPTPLPVQPPLLPTTDTNTGPDPLDPTSELDADDLADEHDHHWDTYVGGLHGSGVDNVDQAGSYGYPSSLGASYLESYMQNRPLSVRMQAADKAGLSEREKRAILEKKTDQEKVQDEQEDEVDEEFGMEITGRGPEADDDDMDIVGSMEGL